MDTGTASKNKLRKPLPANKFVALNTNVLKFTKPRFERLLYSGGTKFNFLGGEWPYRSRDDKVKMKTVLVLCTGNSCRSQMAEALLSGVAENDYVVKSAGCSPSGYVHPVAIEVMSEIALEIWGWRSKSHTEFLDQDVHAVITVCGNADQCCPTFQGQVNRYHWGFDDPAEFEGTENEVRQKFRRVRDEIQLVMGAYLAGLKEGRALGEFAEK
jgi:arsenate reductase